MIGHIKIKMLFLLVLLVANVSNAQWEDLTQYDYKNGPIFSIASNSKYIFIATGAGGVLRSDDNGNSWTNINIGLPKKYATTLAVSGKNIFVGLDTEGIFYSENNGDSWLPATSGIAGADMTVSNSTTAFLVKDSSIFVANGNSLYHSSIKSPNWTMISNNFSSEAFAYIGSTLFSAAYGSGVLRSVNNGKDWEKTNSGLTSPFVHCIAVSGKDLFVGAYSGLNQGSGGIFISSDFGNSWKKASNGLPETEVWSLAVSGEKILAGTSDGVFLSYDKGLNWIFTGGVYVHHVFIKDSTVFAANDGLFVYAEISRRPLTSLGSDVVDLKSRYYQTSSKGLVSAKFINPLNSIAKFQIDIPKLSGVQLKVYDNCGREIGFLLNKNLPSGHYFIEWKTNGITNGNYFCRLKVGSESVSKRFILTN